MYRFLMVTALLTVGGLLAVLAISAAGPEPDAVICYEAAVHNLDPARMSWMHDIRTANGLWEGLLTTDPKTLDRIPGVAERHEVSDDGKTWTFHLRDDARWSNGAPVTSHDFRFAWMRVLDPAMAADYVGYMQLIEGGQEYYEAMGRWNDWQSAHGWPANRGVDAPGAPPRPSPDGVAIRCPDERTLSVTLVRPVPYFPELVAFPTMFPLHEASMRPFLRKPATSAAYYDPDWLKPGNLVTNGPFVLAEWEFRQRLVLVRNTHYWDRANVPSERLELRIIDDKNTAFLSYESGAVDMLTNLPEGVVGPKLIALTDAGERGDVHIFPVWGTYYYRFNCKQPPLDDPRVRRALTMAVDREQIVKHITRRGERAQTSMVTPGLFATDAEGVRVTYEPAEGLAFNPKRARELLAEAGFGHGGKPFPPLKLLVNSKAHQTIGEAVCRMWAKHLGVAIELDLQTSNVAGNLMNEHHFDIARSGWFTDYGDPMGFLEMFVTGDGNNDGQFAVEAYDQLIREAAGMTDVRPRFDKLRRAEHILVNEQCGVLPIYQYVGQFIYRDELKGVYTNNKQQIMLKHVTRD